MISDSESWKKLKAHAEIMKKLHLRALLADAKRCEALVAEHDGIYLDYSRENVGPDTMSMLYELAAAAGLKDKMAAMASGAHINNTENRAVMHTALRAPASKSIVVDGENVVPAVHAVLEKVISFYLYQKIISNTFQSQLTFIHPST